MAAIAQQDGLQQSPAGQEETRIPPIPRHRCPTLDELGYQFRTLSDIRLDIRIRDPDAPADCSVNVFRAGDRAAPDASRMATEFHWVASELYHLPSYFEDTLLERYGQAHHPLLQPWLSGAHFFGMFPSIPYRIGVDRTHDRIYTLGYYRPGSLTPCLRRRLPLEADAAGLEAATWLGLIFLLP